MSKKKIYLAGNISSDPATYKWRVRAIELLSEKFIVLNPTANYFNKKLLKDHKGDTESFIKEVVSRSQRILIVKDFNLVQSSDIILVNVALVTPDKPPIGTVYELAWSWLLKKPIIAIVGDNLYSKHPFTRATFSAEVDTLEDAVTLIEEFFEE